MAGISEYLYFLPPSQDASHHRDFHTFVVRESQPKPLFVTGILGGGGGLIRNPCIFWHTLRSYSPCLTKCDDATSQHTSCFSRTITKQLRRPRLIQMRALGQHILPANLGMRRAWGDGNNQRNHGVFQVG